MVSAEYGSSNKENNRTRFLKFQLTALLATSIDFLMTIIFREVFDFHYSAAVALGASCGAITAFTLNRFWVFKAFEKHPAQQAFRYLLVAAGSVILNTAGTYLVTEFLKSQYLISKAIISIIVGFTYSYYFSRRFVFYA